MKSNKNEKLDLLRSISCIAVLFYHIGILKGGFLAVCIFFVLTGYLSYLSYEKNNYTLKEYYSKRFKKIYCPLLIVVFTTIAVLTFIPSIKWLNLKPETTSIILGYNNFWQINANQDYFVRFISSPFMHLWYIAILIQFELVFPILYKGISFLKKKGKSFIPILILSILSIVSIIYFINTCQSNTTTAYYSTFSRIFSILLGMILGILHSNNKQMIIKNEKIQNILYCTYIGICILLFLLIDSNSYLFNSSLIIITILALRLIDYSKNGNIPQSINNISQRISKISYEIYLIQYPIIFLLQNTKIPSLLKILLIITITVFLSIILNKMLNNKKKEQKQIKTLLVPAMSILITIFGLYQYVLAKDNTEEMKNLASNLDNNRKIIEQKQKEALEKSKEEQEEWSQFLEDLNSNEETLKERIRNSNIVGIGDSIMELAVNDLYNEFPNGYFDAQTNRTERVVCDILNDLKDKNLLGDTVLFNIGTNGEWSDSNKDRIMEILEDRKVFWVNATNADYPTFNENLENLAARYDNIYIIDWLSVANEHPEYLISDGVHQTIRGCKVYAEFIFNSIYEQYLKDFNEQKEKKLKEHEEQENNKITFIGNDMLLGLYDELKNTYPYSDFIIDEDFDEESINKKIKELKKENSLSPRMVFLFNQKINLSKQEIKNIIEQCKDTEITMIDTIGDTSNIKDIELIHFNKQLRNNKNYTQIDGIHLTKKGNKALQKEIQKIVKEKKNTK